MAYVEIVVCPRLFWWVYEATPNQQTTGWYENEVGRIVKVGHGVPNPDWGRSLKWLGK